MHHKVLLCFIVLLCISLAHNEKSDNDDKEDGNKHENEKHSEENHGNGNKNETGVELEERAGTFQRINKNDKNQNKGTANKEPNGKSEEKEKSTSHGPSTGPQGPPRGSTSPLATLSTSPTPGRTQPDLTPTRTSPVVETSSSYPTTAASGRALPVVQPPAQTHQNQPSQPQAQQHQPSPAQPQQNQTSRQPQVQHPSPTQTQNNRPSPSQSQQNQPSPQPQVQHPSPTQTQNNQPSPSQSQQNQPSPQPQVQHPSPTQTHNNQPSPSQSQQNQPSPQTQQRPSPTQTQQNQPPPEPREQRPSPVQAQQTQPPPNVPTVKPGQVFGQRPPAPAPSPSGNNPISGFFNTFVNLGNVFGVNPWRPNNNVPSVPGSQSQAAKPLQANGGLNHNPDGTLVTRPWFVDPYHGGYKKNGIDVMSNRNQHVDANFDKSKKTVDMNVQSRGRFGGQVTNNGEGAEMVAPGGKKASVDDSRAIGPDGSRSADVNGHHADLLTSKRSQTADLVADRQYKLDTVVRNDSSNRYERVNAKDYKGNTYEFKPSSPVQPKQKLSNRQTGTITRNGVKYDYVGNKASNSDLNAQLTNVGQDHKTYTCQTQKVGISNCIDNTGQKFGEVVTQNDGTVIVKKSIRPGVDIPIGVAKVEKTSDGKYQAVLNKGLFTMQTGKQTQRDCMSDYGKRNETKVKIMKPFKFTYNSEKQGEYENFQFPDCFNIGGRLWLAPGVDANRIAIQFDVSILPAGKLKCVDAAACTKECYYCNICGNSRKLDIMSNVNEGNVCTAKGGNTYDVKATVCPPPDTFNWGMCSGFTKSDPSYFQKKGDIQGKALVWLRSPNEVTVTQEFYDKLRNDQFGINRKLWVIRYGFDKKQILNLNPTDYDLKEWYLQQNGAKDEIAACTEVTATYTMMKSGAAASFLLEGASLVAAPQSLFDTRQCPSVDKINQAEAQDEAQQAAANTRSKPTTDFWSSFWG